jgi:hypothetical protein
LNKTSVWSACVSKFLTDILFYVQDIHTTVYAYYKRYQSYKIVSIRASIRPDS